MIDEGSILRRLPQALEPELRLGLEAMVFAVDTMTHSVSTLRELAARYGLEVGQAPPRVRVALFQAAWSIVDQLHVARQLVRRLVTGDYGPELQAFEGHAATATLMRNSMDHLHAMIPNLAKAKGRRAPLLGSLSYVFLGPDDFDTTGETPVIVGSKVVVMMSGSVLPDHTLPCVNPAGRNIQPPVDLFELSAGYHTLPISEAAASLVAAVTLLEGHCNAQFPIAALALAEAEGRALDDYLGNLPAGLTVIMTLTAGSGEPTPSGD